MRNFPSSNFPKVRLGLQRRHRLKRMRGGAAARMDKEPSAVA